MIAIKHIWLILAFVLVNVVSSGQSRMSFNNIPLNKQIHVELLGADKDLLHCYNLYGFAYVTPTDSVTGEFVVSKFADTFSNLYYTDLKLCKIKEFAIKAGRECRHIKVDKGIRLKYPSMDGEVFLNFDPKGPEPVFIPCK